MAPRNSTIKRKKSEVAEKPVKKAASVTSNVTTTTTDTTTRRTSQPLAPSTSQNSVAKSSTTAKHKPRNPSQSNIKLEPSITVQTAKSRKPVVLSSISIANVPGPKLNVYVFGSGSMGELG